MQGSCHSQGFVRIQSLLYFVADKQQFLLSSHDICFSDQAKHLMEDIKDKNDIRIIVDVFYDKVKRDQQIGPVFFGAIKGDWQLHLDRMYAFWDSVLFSVPGFNGNPFAKHVGLAIERRHFDQWLLLFNETVDTQFSGVVANEAKKRASLIADIFVSRLESLRIN